MSPDRIHRGPNTRPPGFTLIELLVVIFIISLLVALTLTVVPKVKRAVYAAQTQAQLSALSNAIQQYYNDFKSYPGPLANSQLCAHYDKGALQNIPRSLYAAGSGDLQADTLLPAASFANPNYNPQNTTFLLKNITGSQNLVLGLLGGLEMVQTSAGSGQYNFCYNPQDIFSDGVTPAPRGPASLNVTNPKRQQAYIQIKAGDISTPNTTYNGGAGASFVDSSGDLVATDNRSPADAMIPVFLDKYADPLPILYYRTNVGGTAIVGFRNNSTQNGTQLQYSNSAAGTTPTLEIAQYDLMQNWPYVLSRIGTIGTLTTNPNSFHGLRGITSSSNASMLLYTGDPTVDSIDTTVSGQNVPTNSGSNGLAYFKDPTLNPTNSATVSNVYQGVARQKDGYILISAGPDRLYGTHDDLVFPGPLQP